MSGCRCGYADECDGQHAIFYPLQDGGMCAVAPCNAPIVETDEHDAREVPVGEAAPF